MKIEITKTKEVKEIIDVEIPYYYKHDLTDIGDYGDSIIYGKILPDCEYTIHEKTSEYSDRKTYEIEKDSRSNGYFDEKFKSTKEEFEDVKARALEFLIKC